MTTNRIRQLPLFDHLSDADLGAMAGALEERHLARGAVLFNQGDSGHHCFVILSGSLEVITFVGGAELQLEVFRAGQLVGEMALIDRSPRSATVRAVDDSHLVVLGEAAFKALIGSSPELALDMLRRSTARVRTTNQRMIADLERKNAELLKAYQQLQAAQAELIRLNRLEEELAIARKIQNTFLPRQLPQPPGWQVAGFSRSAQNVGGDFYDLIPLADGRLGLVVADVCGKGVTAALFVALTRSLLRAASMAPWIFQGDMGLDAEAVLTGALWMTNDYICREHADSDMFITLFYAVLDTETGRMAFVNAGHNPPLVVGADGASIRETPPGTLPIGIIPTSSYEVAWAEVAPGERLVAFSDGITEAMNAAGEPLGDDRLHAVLRAHPAAPARALVETVVREVDAYAGAAPQADDMTLLVLARAAA